MPAQSLSPRQRVLANRPECRLRAPHQLLVHGPYDDIVNIYLCLGEALMVQPASVNTSAVRG